ncbi:MAG: tetratricopeptide repeat protein, partial [Spirochaetales bacterium]|nr:tetratricopeptide repeat protein [Spirochaetales bacterium]
YYVFCTAVNYREQKENSKARDLLLSAIVLGKEIQDEDEEGLHYFTNKYVRFYDYINHQRFGKYKRTIRLSLDLMSYYYAKTFELIDAEASVYLLKAYDLSKKYHNDFITITSAIHYFIYNSYTSKISRYEYLEEATQLARNIQDVFMELFAQISYIDVIFAECRDRTQNEQMIMSHFYNVKTGMKIGSQFMSPAAAKTIHVLYYTNYAYYLKHKDADMGHIIHVIHQAESFLTNDIDRIGFYRTIATGFGPIVGTPYQLIYTKKNLSLAKRQKHIPMVAQFKATLGYLYMLDGQYKKALLCHKSAKDISRKTNDIHEIHMAYKNLGDLCNCLERYTDAMKFYRKCLEIPINYDDSHKQYVDFSDPVFPKSALAFTLIKINRLEEAAKYIKEVELSMSNIFFGNEIPIFLVFLRCYLSLILKEYDDETIKIMKNCYFDMKQLNPGAVQLVWIKRELTENGLLVE